MSWRDDIYDRSPVVGDLLAFFWQTKWWWLTPVIVVLLLTLALLIFARTSATPPFVYTIF